MIETPRNDMEIAGDVDNIYVTVGTRGMPKSILNLRAGDSAPAVIAPPNANGAGIPRLVPRESGLFLLFADRYFYFRSHALGEWRQYSTPSHKCKPIAFDDAGRKLSVECEGVKHESTDSGATWSKVAV